MEHRWGQRQSTDVMVRFVNLPTTIGVGRVKNISATGAYMETSTRLRRLSLVYLEPAASLSSRGRLGRIAASVVRQDETGVGLEWCELAASNTQAYAGLAGQTSKLIQVKKRAHYAPASPAVAHRTDLGDSYELEFID